MAYGSRCSRSQGNESGESLSSHDEWMRNSVVDQRLF